MRNQKPRKRNPKEVKHSKRSKIKAIWVILGIKIILNVSLSMN